MTTFEKVAYLKGLADGLNLGKETKEEKLLSAIIDVLETIAEDLDALEENALDLGDEIDAISEDLADVEEVVFDDNYDDFDYDDEDEDEDESEHEGCGCGGGSSCCGGHNHHLPVYEITCPACEKTIVVDDNVLALGKIECPSCGGNLELVFDEDGDPVSEKE